MKKIFAVVCLLLSLKVQADYISSQRVCNMTNDQCLAVHIKKQFQKYLFVVSKKKLHGPWYSLFEFQEAPVPTAPMTALRCDSILSNCLFAGNAQLNPHREAKVMMYKTQDGGSNWKKTELKYLSHEQFSELVSLDCQHNLTQCLLLVQSQRQNQSFIENYVLISKDKGQNWSNPIVLNNSKHEFILVSELACDSLNQCFIAARKSTVRPEVIIYQSKDGGYHWNPTFFANANMKNLETDLISNLRCQQDGNICLAIRYEKDKSNQVIQSVYQRQLSTPWKKIATLSGKLKNPVHYLNCDLHLKTCVLRGELTLKTEDSGYSWQEVN